MYFIGGNMLEFLLIVYVGSIIGMFVTCLDVIDKNRWLTSDKILLYSFLTVTPIINTYMLYRMTKDLYE